MTIETKESFIAQYSQTIAAPTPGTAIPFKTHSQFHALIDILSRRSNHHALLSTEFPSKLYPTFLEALVDHLQQDNLPYPLKKAEVRFFNLENALITELKQLSIEKEFEALRDTLDHANQYAVMVLSRLDIFSKEARKNDERFLRRQIEGFLTHPKCRVILLASPQEALQYHYLQDTFTLLDIPAPSNQDVLTILKQQSDELESFHHVIIPDELLKQTYNLAERFLSASNTLDNALLLLDSSAARVGAQPRGDLTEQIKPILTLTTVTEVLSTWTHIPATHIKTHSVDQTEFVQGVQQKLFGQDAAVKILSHELHQSPVHLAKKARPYCSFLFAGLSHSGKKTAAVALAEQLFKQSDMLYFAQPSLEESPITDLKVQRATDKHYLPITEIIQHTPYSVFYFDNVDQLSSVAMDGLQEIITTGILHDDEGNQFDFRQSIIILSTTAGGSKLDEFADPSTPDEDIFTMDLMQLVMSEPKESSQYKSSQYSQQELVSKLLPEISEFLPASILQHVAIAPFVQLNKPALEKIMRLKLKELNQRLKSRFGVELGYAPEVIRHLTNMVLHKRQTDPAAGNPDTALRQLYTCVEQAVLNSAANKHQSNQLILQLNETGQLLRCDWVGTPKQQAGEPSFS